jgi:hypothetical protein
VGVFKEVELGVVEPTPNTPTPTPLPYNTPTPNPTTRPFYLFREVRSYPYCTYGRIAS